MKSKENFERELDERIGDVFAGNPGIRDHREEHPWLTGSLGDPFSGILFLAESPSLRKIEEATERAKNSGRALTPDLQWEGTSKGTEVLRKALVKAGFKEPEWNSTKGWHCCITNVIKEAVYVGEWGKTKKEKMKKKMEASEVWASVLRWQLEQSSPKLVVVMGGTVEKLVRHLEERSMISLPQVRKIYHYSYIAYRPERSNKKRPCMHPDRIEEYQEAMLQIRRRFGNLRVSKAVQ